LKNIIFGKLGFIDEIEKKKLYKKLIPKIKNKKIETEVKILKRVKL
jgi:hypothetical protein